MFGSPLPAHFVHSTQRPAGLLEAGESLFLAAGGPVPAPPPLGRAIRPRDLQLPRSFPGSWLEAGGHHHLQLVRGCGGPVGGLLLQEHSARGGRARAPCGPRYAREAAVRAAPVPIAAQDSVRDCAVCKWVHA